MKKDEALMIKNNLDIFDKNMYSNYFDEKIMTRGEMYYENNLIHNYKVVGNKYTCNIKGTEDYKVSLIYDNDTCEIKEVSCTCPYYESGNNCKHIFALFYKVTCKDNKNVIISEINNVIKDIKEKVKEAEEKINNKKHKLSKSVMYEYNNYIHHYDGFIALVRSKLTNKTLEDTLIKYLFRLNSINNLLKDNIKRTLKNMNIKKIDDNKYFISKLMYNEEENDFINKVSEKYNQRKEKNNNKTSFLDKLIMFSSMLENKNNKSNTSDDYLEDWQQKLVNKKEYDAWNFEEEDLEEDDYYYEDD